MIESEIARIVIAFGFFGSVVLVIAFGEWLRQIDQCKTRLKGHRCEGRRGHTGPHGYRIYPMGVTTWKDGA